MSYLLDCGVVVLDVYKEWLGIPEGQRPPDHYELLRLVQFEDEVEKVRNNYKKLNNHVRKYASGQYSVRSQELLNEMAKAMLCLTDPERKREYDESLGREFEDETDALGRKPLLNSLVDQKLISRAQIKEVQDFADIRGLSVRDAVVQMKLADAEVATQALALESGLPFVDLEDMLPEDDVMDLVPRKVVRRHSCLPLFVDGDYVLVACSDIPEVDLEDEFRLRFNKPMRPCLATPRSIKKYVERYYAPGVREESIAAAAEAAGEEAPAKAGKRTGRADKPKKTPAAKVSMAERSDEEQKQRKQVGMILMLWATMGSYLGGYFLLSTMWWLPAVIIVPLTVFFVTQIYWK